MSELIRDQYAVVASLQRRLKTLADANGVPAGSVKDLAMALAASIDKLEVLKTINYGTRPSPDLVWHAYRLEGLSADDQAELVQAWGDPEAASALLARLVAEGKAEKR